MKSSFLLAFVVASTTAAFSQAPASKPNPDSAKYFLQKGLDEKGNGRRLESLKNFEKAVENAPGEFAYQYGLGNAYYKQAYKNKKKIDTPVSQR